MAKERDYTVIIELRSEEQEKVIGDWLCRKALEGPTPELAYSAGNGEVWIDEFRIGRRGSLIFYRNLVDRSSLNRVICSIGIGEELEEIGLKSSN